MSIATQIQRLQAAKADIKSAIENKGVTVGDGTIDTYAEKIGEIETGGDYDQGYEDGKQAEYDIFWDNYQNNGQKTVYRYAFAYNWTNDIFNPKYDIKPTSANYMFYESQISTLADCEKIDLSNCTEMEYFARFSIIKDFPPLDLSKATKKLSYSFSTCYNLESLTLNNVQSSCTFVNTFALSKKLKELRITGTIGQSIGLPDSLLLSNESVQSVIDSLADLTGATTQTLTLHADVGAKLTDEQKATITAKNWTLVY